jgi:lactate dehydrogenase-like 2-hydroxyacid dehydrogenase
MRLFAYSVREFDELPYFQRFADEYGFEFGYSTGPHSSENIGLAEGYDAVSFITYPMTAEMLGRLAESGVRGVATRSIGYDHIDVATAERLGLRCAHAAYPPEGVADYAIMMMLMAMRKAKLVLGLAGVQEFSLKGKLGGDISSSTVGIVGTGRIGATVARHLSGFGCKILAYDPYENDAIRDLVTYVSLDELLEGSDVVTLHAPATPENFHMIGAEQLARMPEGAIIVNCARGSLIDQSALIGAIESGHLGGAALDCLENEAPLMYFDKTREIIADRDRAILSSFPNVIVSPHMAFYTAIDVQEMVRSNVEALMAFDQGLDTPYEVHAS